MHHTPNWLGQPGVPRARGSLYEFVLYNSYKKCMNWYKNHTVYEFVLHGLYNNCMNSFVWIRTKISEKKRNQVGILTRDQYGLQSSPRLPSATPPAAYKLYTLIPFLTQPPHERTLTGWGSRVYPALPARCMNSYYTIRIKNVWIGTKNHTVYEFVLHDLYNNCMNSFVWILTKISEKKETRLGFQPGTKMACNRRLDCHPPPHRLHQWPFYLYTVQ